MRSFRRVSLALAVLAFLFRAAAAHADSAFAPGQTAVSAGVGFGVAGIYGTSSAPMLSVAVDRGMSDVFSMGGVLGFSSSKDTYDSFANYGWKYSYALVGVRGSYHLKDFVDDARVDLYVGGMLGYNHVSATPFAEGQTGTGASASYVLYGIHAGGRYFFTPKLAGFAELGYGMGNLAVGMTARL